MKSLGPRVKPAPVGGFHLGASTHENGSEGTLRRYIHVAAGGPRAEQCVDLTRRFPALPADGERPGRCVASASFRGHFGGLQRADEVVTVRAMKVTHVAYFTSLVQLFGQATPESVTSLFPRHSGPVTCVTQDSSHSLRARTRRPSKETYVPKNLSMLASDIKTPKHNYQLHCGHTHPWSDSTKVLSLLSLGGKS